MIYLTQQLVPVRKSPNSLNSEHASQILLSALFVFSALYYTKRGFPQIWMGPSRCRPVHHIPFRRYFARASNTRMYGMPPARHIVQRGSRHKRTQAKILRTKWKCSWAPTSFFSNLNQNLIYLALWRELWTSCVDNFLPNSSGSLQFNFHAFIFELYPYRRTIRPRVRSINI